MKTVNYRIIQIIILGVTINQDFILTNFLSNGF